MTAPFALAAGISGAGAGIAIIVTAELAALARQPLSLNGTGEYLRVASTGLLWGIGNYGMLLGSLK